MKNGNGFEAAEAARHRQAGLHPAEDKQWLGTPRFIQIDSHAGQPNGQATAHLSHRRENSVRS
jgi:hypothetical protein